jgi:hypothetical protein
MLEQTIAEVAEGIITLTRSHTGAPAHIAWIW